MRPLLVLGDRALVVRAGLIAGPGDPSDRVGYRPARFRRGGTVLTPPTAGRDVRVLHDEEARGLARDRRSGLSPAEGEALVALLR